MKFENINDYRPNCRTRRFTRITSPHGTYAEGEVFTDEGTVLVYTQEGGGGLSQLTNLTMFHVGRVWTWSQAKATFSGRSIARLAGDFAREVVRLAKERGGGR